jgi:hypothetical protein
VPASWTNQPTVRNRVPSSSHSSHAIPEPSGAQTGVGGTSATSGSSSTRSRNGNQYRSVDSPALTSAYRSS